MLFIFLKGLTIGFAIAAPVGPIGLLCIQRSLRSGFKIGLMTGLGAATADSFYGLIVALGLTALSAFLVTHQLWIHFLGGFFLILFGLKLIIKHEYHKLTSNSQDDSSWHAYGTSFLLTITNPVTILAYIAICAGLGLGTEHREYFHAVILVSGIFLGSSLWWFFLSGFVARVLHHRVNEKLMQLIDKISGAMLIVFGIAAFFF
jgi:threonine/homoserine/homoserine lactone efflux protein